MVADLSSSFEMVIMEPNALNDGFTVLQVGPLAYNSTSRKGFPFHCTNLSFSFFHFFFFITCITLISCPKCPRRLEIFHKQYQKFFFGSPSLLKIPLWNLGKVVVLGSTSQSEKGRQPPMEDRYLSRQGSGVWRSLRDGDFEEEDVWDVIRDGKKSNITTGRSKESSVSVPRRLPTASRMIPKASSHNYGSGSSYSSSNNTHEAKIVQQSAPVHIPNWSKAYGEKSNKDFQNRSWHNDCDDADDDEVGNGGDEDEEEEEDDYDSREPPHEFIARKLARSQISSFSVFEGAGRTLKGRDLSKVRNAVLSKTGFLESL